MARLPIWGGLTHSMGGLVQTAQEARVTLVSVPQGSLFFHPGTSEAADLMGYAATRVPRWQQPSSHPPAALALWVLSRVGCSRLLLTAGGGKWSCLVSGLFPEGRSLACDHIRSLSHIPPFLFLFLQHFKNVDSTPGSRAGPWLTCAASWVVNPGWLARPHPPPHCLWGSG